MCEIVEHQLLENIERLKNTKNVVFRFESLLKNLFFQAVRNFPGMLEK